MIDIMGNVINIILIMAIISILFVVFSLVIGAYIVPLSMSTAMRPDASTNGVGTMIYDRTVGHLQLGFEWSHYIIFGTIFLFAYVKFMHSKELTVQSY